MEDDVQQASCVTLPCAGMIYSVLRTQYMLGLLCVVSFRKIRMLRVSQNMLFAMWRRKGLSISC